MTRFALLAFIALPMAKLNGQDSTPLDPTVSYVVTGGRWSDSTGGGEYRVIVRTGGFEHVGSALSIEWLQEPRNQDDPGTVTCSRHSGFQGIWLLELPRLTCNRTQCQVQVRGTNTRNDEKGSWTITIQHPGHYSISRGRP